MDVMQVAPRPPTPARRQGSRVWLGCLGLLVACVVVVGGAVAALVVLAVGGHWGSGSLSIDAGTCDDSEDALVRAAADGDVAKVRASLAHHARVDAVDADGNAALACGVVGGSPDVVRVLLAAGADPNLAGAHSFGSICLGYWDISTSATMPADCGLPAVEAAAAGRTDLLELLLDHGAHPTPALLEASVKDDAAVARIALAHGADPDGDGGTTPLVYNAAFGNDGLLALLLAHGADPNRGGDADAASLRTAVALLNGRANTPPNAGLTTLGCSVQGRAPNLPPLVVAAAIGDPTAVRALLAHHADPDATAGFVPPVSALAAARATGHPGIATLLRSAGARVVEVPTTSRPAAPASC